VAALQLRYPEGAVAQVHSSAAGASPDTGLVLGTEGWLRLDRRLHRPSSLTVSTSEGVESHPGTDYGNSYGPQVAEVEHCLRAGLTESVHVPLDDTVGVLELIDEAREQLGVRYPADMS
jgi:hypothetical protein